MLATLAAAGSREAFERLVVRHEARVYAFVRRLLPQPADAEDVAQETFLQAWRSIARYRPRWRFVTWLLTIARRRAGTSMRRRRPVTAAVDPPGVSPDPAVAAERRELHGHLWRLAERLLSPRERTALWLRCVEGLSMGEIGHVLGLTPLHARVLVHRARRALLEADERKRRRSPVALGPVGSVVPGGLTP
jgi:RNA polymerase sigma-70 factor (ECF subfamily)